MAFPVVEATATTVNETRATSHPVNLPSGITAGDLLLMAFYSRGSVTITWPSGWTEVDQYAYTAGVKNVTGGIAYRIADGSEGSTVTVTINSSRRIAAVIWRISGADTAVAPEFSRQAGDSTNPDSPALTPSWGAVDTLWLSIEGHTNGASSVTSYPANYSGGVQALSSGSAGRADAAGAYRQLNASSEDPGQFTIANTASWVAYTVSISPRNSADLAASLPRISAQASASVAVQLDLSSTLPSPSLSSSVSADITLSLSSAIPLAAADFSVSRVPDVDLAASLPAISLDASASVEVGVDVSSTLPSVSGSLSVSTIFYDADLIASLSQFSASASASVEVSSSTQAVLPLTQSKLQLGVLVDTAFISGLPVVGAAVRLYKFEWIDDNSASGNWGREAGLVDGWDKEQPV